MTRAKLREGGVRAPALPIRGCSCGGPQPEPKKRKGPGRPRKPRPACSTCDGTGVLPWHPQTRATWAIYWASPMAGEWIEADLPGLTRLIFVVEDFWRCESARDRRELEAEIGRQEAKFGLSPLDRRRLEWELERPEAPEKPAPEEPPRPVVDPRDTLRLVG